MKLGTSERRCCVTRPWSLTFSLRINHVLPTLRWEFCFLCWQFGSHILIPSFRLPYWLVGFGCWGGGCIFISVFNTLLLAFVFNCCFLQGSHFSLVNFYWPISEGICTPAAAADFHYAWVFSAGTSPDLQRKPPFHNTGLGRAKSPWPSSPSASLA